eukprot:SAG11_NODE_731_length_7473_cov_5.500949_6_plen_45_part_00
MVLSIPRTRIMLSVLGYVHFLRQPDKCALSLASLNPVLASPWLA